MKLTQFIFLSWLLFALSSSAFSQESGEKVYDVNYNNESFDKILADLEQKSGLVFYYKPEDIGGSNFTLSLKSASIRSILTEMLKGTTFHFVIKDNQVFLTKDIKLETSIDILNNDNASVSKNRDATENKSTDANVFNKLYEVGQKTNEVKKGTATIVGYLRDELTKLPVQGGRISSLDRKIFSISGPDGSFSITLPLGLNYLTISANEMRSAKRQIMLYGDGKLNIEIREDVELLREVKILSQRGSTLKNLEMGVNKLSIAAIKQVPTVFGEADVLRVVLTLPGVQSVGEASTGFNVRGGSADQNLILLDNSTIYNPSHFFGFFSAFNPDIVKDVQLYKSTIPEKFGGRLSSVLEVSNRQGDKTKLKGSAGIGLITSRFNIEAPIDSGKTSFILGGRATYSNWLLDLLPDEYKNSKASFYDGNLGISHQINKNNEINLTAYHSRDNFKLNSDTSYNYSNKNASLEWRKKFSTKLNGIFKAAVDSYNYDIKSDQNPVNAYQLKFNINQTNLRAEFKYGFNNKHFFNFGLSSTYYNLSPGEFLPLGSKSLVIKDVLQREKALETAVFFGDEFKINDKLSVNMGLRYSLFNTLGARDVASYAENLPKSNINMLGVKHYGNNEIINTYHAPEIRLSGTYILANDLSVKASYNTLRQYIHLLSNTTSISPTDVWKLSDPNIRPQKGSQIALGLYKNFASQTIETSIEGYYKRMDDYLDYKSGANLILNHNIEQDVVSTKGKAYGVELFLKKTTGKLNGWVSYAYSRTLLKMDDVNAGPLINNGEYYPANYDKPHSFNFTGNYKLKQRYHFSLNFTYSTGRPITLPIAKYNYGGSERVYYSDRNLYRIPDYLRMDISFNVEGNHKVKQLTHNSWTFGIYNVTARRNIFSTFFAQEGGMINGYSLSIFATAIPFVNYNIRF
ncbi:TonB-dependent receptor plug domain-containing protein [Pedobacter sp.]|uniref:TonB-dependent receptor plug domain-containing protein n=1 Tax=Pedobacter sp. TaxID=1411316 RepID=UPI0031D15C3A